MSSIVIPPAQLLAEVALKVLEADYVGAKLHLYSNDMTPTPASVLGDFTECVFSGYSAKTVVWSAAFYDENNVPASSGGEALFTMSGATPDVAYGAFLTDTAGTKLLWSARLDTPPFSFVKTGDTLAVSNKMGLTTGTLARDPGP